MKKQRDILRKKGSLTRYMLIAAAFSVVCTTPALMGAGMNASSESCASGSVFRLFKAVTAIIPVGEPVYQIDEDRQLKPDTTISRADASAPAKLFADQNFPNPFRASTSIRYGLPRNSYVKVTIHTMLGSPVQTLLEESQPAGVYTLEMTVPDLMPGIYFYRIQTEYGAVTRRMTISK